MSAESGGGGAVRYIVDERIGCIAVVDTLHPAFPSGNGLHFDYDEVVAYWTKMDENVKGAVDENRLTVEFARRLCTRLNAERSNLTIQWKKNPDGMEGFVLGEKRIASITDHGNYAAASVYAPNFLHYQTLSRVGGGQVGVDEAKQWCESNWYRFVDAVKAGVATEGGLEESL